MKIRYPAILAVLVIILALTVAGCTSSSSPNPTATAVPGQTTATTVATPTAAPSSGGASTLASVIDYSKVHWDEYQMTSTGSGTSSTMDMREDYGVSYQGTTANEATVTMNNTEDGTVTTMVMNSYSNPSTGAILGGHETMSTNGQVVMDTAIPSTAASATITPGESTQNPIQAYGGATLTNAGTESVTVPAGTFTATKYTWTSTDGTTGNVWIAKNVPIPVKMTSTVQGNTVAIVLTGWG